VARRHAALSRLAAAGIQLGIVTNSSRRLGMIAADQVGVKFARIVTAEDAGWYKPDPRPYQLALDSWVSRQTVVCSWQVPPTT